MLDPAAVGAVLLDPAAALPGVQPIDDPRIVDLEDRYIDTADRALRTRGLVARLRSGAAGPRRLTIKSLARRGSGAVHRRLELEADVGDGDDPRGWPPSIARDLLLEAVGADPLETLVVIRQRRHQRDVGFGSSVIELSLDEVEVAGTASGGSRWVDLEAELRSGSERDLAALGAVLLRRPDLEPATTSKLDRAVSLVERPR